MAISFSVTETVTEVAYHCKQCMFHVAGAYCPLYYCNAIAIVVTYQYYQSDLNKSSKNITDDNKCTVMKLA